MRLSGEGSSVIGSVAHSGQKNLSRPAFRGLAVVFGLGLVRAGRRNISYRP
jgi:hypothetical protein